MLDGDKPEDGAEPKRDFAKLLDLDRTTLTVGKAVGFDLFDFAAARS